MKTLHKVGATLFVTFAACTILTLNPSPSHAVCYKQCTEAKKYCSNYEKSNPGEKCGTARGYICRSKDWKKIKQVNPAWIACRYKGNDAHIQSANARCAEFKKNWGGACQINSPHCKAGWIKLGKWGKITACRKIKLSGGVLYSGYRSYMRKFEGKAKHKLPVHIHPFLKKHYSFDPKSIRFGLVKEVRGATCIADCYNIYCDKKWAIDSMKSGFGMKHLPFHELQHSSQCHKKGGRKNYAHYWFKQVPGSFFKALNPKKIGDFKTVLHDTMPMEKEADKRADAILPVYSRQWWHKSARCRIYKSDKKTVISELDKKGHPRYYCDPAYNQPGAKSLKVKAKDLAKDIGGGRYHFALGRPDQNNGVWLGHIDIRHKILETGFGVNYKGDTCPKKPVVKALIASQGMRSYRVRLNRNGIKSKWRKITSKKVGNGYLAGIDFKPNVKLGPGRPHKFRVEIKGEKPTAWKKFPVKCS